MTKTVKILLAVFALLALGFGGVAVAQTSGGDAGGGRAPGASALRDRPRAVRGDLTVMTADRQTKQVHIERGKVSEVSDNGFTLTGPDGVVNHITVDDQTKVRPSGTKISDLDGKGVTVVAEAKDGDNWVATHVVLKRARRNAQGQQGQDQQGQGQPGQDQDNGQPAQPSNDLTEMDPAGNMAL